MDKNKKSPLADKLIKLRKAKGLTQSQIAESLNIKRSTYAYYECSTTPPVDILRKLAKLFDTTVDEMVGNQATHYVYNPDNHGDVITFHQGAPGYNSEMTSEKLTGDERILLARYQILPPDMKIKVQEYLRDCVDDVHK